MVKKNLATLLSTVLIAPLMAQENQGAINDNYNPVNGQYINPSNIVDAKPWLDINLIGASAFVRNNYAYYPNTILLNFDSFKEQPSFYTNRNMINGYADFDVKGPSASIVLQDHALSLFTNVRGITNISNLPGIVGRMASEGGITLADTGSYEIDNVRIKSMTWGELGLTYGKILKKQGYNMYTGAITLKRLYGFQNASVLVDDAIFDVVDTKSGILASTNSKYSYAAPDFNAGRGWGTNLGFTYKRMKDDVTHYVPHSKFSGCQQINYKYKIGVSLLDVGYITFKNNSYYGTYNENTVINDLNDAQDVSDETQAIQEGEKFTSYLPMAASVQFDYNVNDKVYLNATAVQRIPMANSFGVERANLLAVSARYEIKRFGVGLPITMQNYDYTTAQIGLAFRFANVTIGSDNFLPIIIKHDVKAADIYFSLKYTIFKSPACKEKRKNKSGRRGSVDCPAWDF